MRPRLPRWLVSLVRPFGPTRTGTSGPPPRSRLPILWLVLVTAAIAAIVASSLPRGQTGPVLTSDQRKIIDELVSVLLHDTTVPQYARIVNQYDSRGFVSGIGDFSTSDGSTLAVVRTYHALVGDTDLSRNFLSTLERLAATGSGDTDELVGFVDAWRRASDDPAFRQAQTEVLYTRSYLPAFERARELGLTSALGVAILYDTLLQHGGAGDPDGLPALITRTRDRMGGLPPDVRERDWLVAFLDERTSVLLAPTNPEHRAMWPLTTGRVAVFAELLAAGRFDLAPPLLANPYGTPHVIVGRSDDDVPIGGGTAAPVPTLSADPSQPASSPSAPTSPGPSTTTPPPTTPPPTIVPSPPTTSQPPTTPQPSTTAPPAPASAVTPTPGLLVRVVHPTSGKALGVAGASTQDGARIVLSSGTSPAEQWRLSLNGSGCFRLVNAKSGQALDNPNGSQYLGAPVQQWTSGPFDNPNQAWCFDPAGDGRYLIRSLVGGLVLDVTDGQTADGTPIQLWEGWTQNPNQVWRLEAA